MTLNHRLKIFVHKLTHWEYWPIWVVYFPCFIMYPIYALVARSPLFFTTANPGLENSGAFLTSKYRLHEKFNKEQIPSTLLVHSQTTIQECLDFTKENNLTFPLIAKPDLGLRGLGIKLIWNETQMAHFLKIINQAYLLQEFVDYDNEIGVFLIREPNKELYISSIVERVFVSLKGDGIKTIKELILEVPRFSMQYEWLSSQYKVDLNRVPKYDESIEFEKVGNHSKGTLFSNGNYLISEKMTTAMQQIIAPLEGFNYGRLDIKYLSVDDLHQAKNYSIIELNGVFSEPGHIYDPKNNLFSAWKILLSHFHSLYKISVQSMKEGHQPMRFKKGKQLLKKHFAMTSKMKE